MNVFGSSLPSSFATAASAGVPPMKLKRDQVLCGRRQDLMSSFGNKNHIFDSDSTFFRNVDAWLNRNDHPWLKLLGLPLGQPRLLVHLNSHSVPRGMGKKSAKAGFFQYFSASMVHFAGLRAWPYRPDRGQLRFPHRLVHAPARSGNRPNMHSAGHVRTVTCEYNTVIQDYKSLRGNGLRPCTTMWQGRST